MGQECNNNNKIKLKKKKKQAWIFFFLQPFPHPAAQGAGKGGRHLHGWEQAGRRDSVERVGAALAAQNGAQTPLLPSPVSSDASPGSPSHHRWRLPRAERGSVSRPGEHRGEEPVICCPQDRVLGTCPACSATGRCKSSSEVVAAAGERSPQLCSGLSPVGNTRCSQHSG